MNGLQEHQFWVGLGFAAAFVFFLMVAFFAAKDLTPGQRLILRIMSSLCGAIAGALVSGEAFFNLSREVPGGKLTVSGTAGFAILFVIWFFFPKEPTTPTFPNGFNSSIPNGWTFQDAADTFAKNDLAVITYEGFSAQELASPLKAWTFKTRTPREALERLGSITDPPGAIRKYRAFYRNSAYTLKIT
jgi:hypothetical protein